MFKCKNCGNSEKFFGTALERGNAVIYSISENPHEYNWRYNLSDSSWKSILKPSACFYCGSKEIESTEI